MALPGEFTFRAVRNGKMRLNEADALRSVIEAKSTYEIHAARKQIGKNKLKVFEGIAARIRSLLAKVELSIDFSDQDVEVIPLEELNKELKEILSELEKLSEQLHAARKIAGGLNVVLTGKPNAGKSTLFNAILSEERAIVSEEQGTTRDVITEEIVLDPYRIRLADTAGIRETKGHVEKEGIERALEMVKNADLVLEIIDATESVASVNPNDLLVLNKWDAIDQKKKEALLSTVSRSNVVCVSASNGEGITDLLRKMTKTLDEKYGIGRDSFLPSEFQLQMLTQCQGALGEALEHAAGFGLKNPELLSSSLFSAARALSDIIGETTPDTVLTQIFSEFCIGK